MVDIDFGGGRLYQGDGRDIVAQQVARYLEHPLRVFRMEPIGGNLSSHVSLHMLRAMLAECQTLGLAIEQLPAEPHYEGSFLVVLGIGLGFHLPALIAGTGARHVVLVEPHPAFLVHAFAAFDWLDFFDTQEAAGRRFSVLLGDNPASLVLDIMAAIRRGPELCVDGSFVFVHYPAKILIEIRDHLGRYFDVLFQSFGFYEDERLMLANALTNLTRPGVRLIDGAPGTALPVPALIIATGPSLDQSIAIARQLAGRAVVFSCGTALQACLKNGITPDYHCEAENVAHTFDILAHTISQFPTKDISLIASITVDPRVPELFGESLMYFREASSSTKLLAPPGAELLFSSPTVANTALRTALSLGFTTLYLFGVDFGTRQRGHHHASDTAYRELAFMADYDRTMELTNSVPGNFGGTVGTDSIFNLARLSAGKVCTASGLTVYNCSDGAQIEGARPCPPATVHLPPLPLPRARLCERIRMTCRPMTATPTAAILSRTVAQGERYFSDLLAAIDAAAAKAEDVVDFWDRLEPFLGPQCGQDGVATLVTGTLRTLPKLAGFFLFRIRDATTRRRLFARFLTEYRFCVEAMRDDSLTTLTRSSARNGHERQDHPGKP